MNNIGNLTKSQSDKLMAYRDALRQLPIEVVMHYFVIEMRARPDFDKELSEQLMKIANDLHWDFL
jgi:hypothetical protein